MQTEIRALRVPLTHGFRRQIEHRLGAAFGRFAHAVTRVRVRFADLNDPRGGVDKRCQRSVDLRPGGRVLVEAEALARASAVLTRQLGRSDRPARLPPELMFDPAT